MTTKDVSSWSKLLRDTSLLPLLSRLLAKREVSAPVRSRALDPDIVLEVILVLSAAAADTQVSRIRSICMYACMHIYNISY